MGRDPKHLNRDIAVATILLFVSPLIAAVMTGCQDHKKAAPERKLVGTVKVHSIHFSHVYDQGRQLSAYHVLVEFGDESTVVVMVYCAKIQADVSQGKSMHLDVIGEEPSLPAIPIVVLHVHHIDDIKFTSKK